MGNKSKMFRGVLAPPGLWPSHPLLRTAEYAQFNPTIMRADSNPEPHPRVRLTGFVAEKIWIAISSFKRSYLPALEKRPEMIKPQKTQEPSIGASFLRNLEAYAILGEDGFDAIRPIYILSSIWDADFGRWTIIIRTMPSCISELR